MPYSIIFREKRVGGTCSYYPSNVHLSCSYGWCYLKGAGRFVVRSYGFATRNALVAVVFSKSLRLSPVARQANSGTINNIFNNDKTIS